MKNNIFTLTMLTPKITILLLSTILVACQNTPTKETIPQTKAITPLVANVTTTTIATPLSPNETVNYQQGLDYLYIQQYTEAQKILEPIAKNHPQHFGAWVNLSTAYYGENNIHAAQNAAQHAVKIDDKEPDIHNLLGLLAVEDKQYKTAEASYLLAIKIAPKFALAHYNLALLYDIYYQDIPTAYKHYNLYLTNTKQEDTKTQEWVDQLKYSLGSN